MPDPSPSIRARPPLISPSFTKEDALNFISAILRKKTEPGLMDKLLFRKPPGVPPQINFKEGSEAEGRAALDAVRMYPEAANKLRSINLGKKLSPGVGGQYYGDPYKKVDVSEGWNGPYQYSASMDVLRHELGHAQGLDDYGPSPNAYDLSTASNFVHQDEPYGRDVNLPDESIRTQNKPKKGIGPSNKVMK